MLAVILVLMIAFVLLSMAAYFHCAVDGRSRIRTLPCIAHSMLLFVSFAVGVSFGVEFFYEGGHQELRKIKLGVVYRRDSNSTMDPQSSEGDLMTLFLREFT